MVSAELVDRSSAIVQGLLPAGEVVLRVLRPAASRAAVGAVNDPHADVDGVPIAGLSALGAPHRSTRFFGGTMISISWSFDRVAAT